jgi:exodeoxyribonuclease III
VPVAYEAMRLVTWNVNSLRARQARVEALLDRWRPDVVCLQETKLADAVFPAAAFSSHGYESRSFGLGPYCGVAVLSREPATDVRLGYEGDPVPGEPRVMTATVEGLRVVNAYAVNGKAVGDPAYETKLAWFDALIDWIRTDFDPTEPMMLVGDLNVAPSDADVHDPDAWRGRNLASEPERERIRELVDWGLVDVLRRRHEGPGPFTWWDYRAGSFHRGWGLRLDLALATTSVAARCADVRVDRDERKPTAGEGKPSDHAPVVVDLT